MLFGVDLCRRKPCKKRRQSPGIPSRAVLALLAALIVTGLLFLAPQWLLVLLVISLTGALTAVLCLPK